MFPLTFIEQGSFMRRVVMMQLILVILVILLYMHQLHFNRERRIKESLTRVNIYMETMFENVMSNSLDNINNMAQIIKKHAYNNYEVGRILRAFTFRNKEKDNITAKIQKDPEVEEEEREYMSNLNMISIPVTDIFWINNKNEIITPPTNDTLEEDARNDLFDTIKANIEKRNAAIVSDWTANTSDHKAYHLVSICVYDGKKYLGTLFMKIRIKELYYHLMKRAGVGPGTIAPFIISKSGKICLGLTPDARQDQELQKLLKEIVLQVKTEGDYISDQFHIDNTITSGYSYYIKKLHKDQFFAVSITRKNVANDNDNLISDLQISLIPLIPFAVCLLFVSYYFARYAIKPVIELSEVARRVSRGEMKNTIKKYGIKEMNLLANSLENLIEKHKAQKKTAKDLQRFLEESEAGNKAKTSFIRNIQHDLRTPMNHIIGAVDMITTPKKEDAEYVDIIKIASRQMINMIDDIITMTDGMYGKGLVLNKSNIALAPLITKAIENVKMDSKDHNVRILFKNEKGVPNVKLDRSLFRFAITKLLKHAILFSSGGGAIVASLSKVADVVVITIEDSAIHSSQFDYYEEKSKEESLSSSKGTLKSLGKGIKLGLKSVHAIMEAHEANFEIRKTKDMGHITTISLRV